MFLRSVCNSIIALVFFSACCSASYLPTHVNAEEALPVVEATIHTGSAPFYHPQRPVVVIHTSANLGNQNEGIADVVAEPSIILVNQEDPWPISKIQGVATCVVACAFILPQFYADFADFADFAVIDPVVLGFSAICVGAEYVRAFINTYGHCFSEEEFQRKEASRQFLINVYQLSFYVPAITQVHGQKQGAHPQKNSRYWGFALLLFSGLNGYLGKKALWNVWPFNFE